MNDSENTLIAHLDALRRTLLRCVTVTALLYPVGYLASPYVINALVQWCFPESAGKLHYFAPMEVFWVQLKLALILALALAYPWNMLQLWALPAPRALRRGAEGSRMVDRFFIGFILRRGGVLHGSDPADADELFRRLRHAGASAGPRAGELPEPRRLADARLRRHVPGADCSAAGGPFRRDFHRVAEA